MQYEVIIDLVEPLGMETMIYFSMNGIQVCGKISPNNPLKIGEKIKLNFSKVFYHIIDPVTDIVLNS